MRQITKNEIYKHYIAFTALVGVPDRSEAHQHGGLEVSIINPTDYEA